jgi:ribosomal protein L37AE/L43A
MRPWETKEWKDRRLEFLKGKQCQWCGTVDHLVMHNQNPPPGYSNLLRHASAELLQRKIQEGKFHTQRLRRLVCPDCGSGSLRRRETKKPQYKCQGCRSEFEIPKFEEEDTGRLSREDWEMFWGEFGSELRQDALESKKRLEMESGSLENYIVLCSRCHMAARNGLTLCPVCHHGYRRPGREMCWECFKKTERGSEIAKLYEKEEMTHPWCGKKFSIEKRWLQLLSEPGIICEEICDLGPGECKVASGRISQIG